MKKYTVLFASFLACLCLAGCSDLSPFKMKMNALIIKPASTTRADNGVIREDGSRVYRIESFFGGGVIPSPDYSVQSYEFYEADFSSWFECQEAQIRPLVCLGAIRYAKNDYSHPGDAITSIRINGIDESLGFGRVLAIRMNQGNYESAAILTDEVSASGAVKVIETDATESIKSVEIKSFKLPQVLGENMTTEDDAEINIVITSKTGGTITLIYSGVEHLIPIT